MGLVLKLKWGFPGGARGKEPAARAGGDRRGLITAGTTWEALVPANSGRSNSPRIIKGPKMAKLPNSENPGLRLHGSGEQKPRLEAAANHTAKLLAKPRAATLMESVSE